MTTAPPPRPLRVLVRNLFLSALLAAGLYAVFLKFNATYLASKGISQPEFLALEAGAILLIAYAVTQSMTSASTALDEDTTRDGVLRAVLSKLPSASRAG